MLAIILFSVIPVYIGLHLIINIKMQKKIYSSFQLITLKKQFRLNY